jgi:preprotein translocase subunit SecB
MQELQKITAPEGEDPSPVEESHEMTVSVRVAINEALGIVMINAIVTPDQRHKPYRIELEVAGEFLLLSGREEHLTEFCKTNGPVILFPYIRQLVDQLTADGRFGRVRLDPINLQAALGGTPWTQEPPLQPRTT